MIFEIYHTCLLLVYVEELETFLSTSCRECFGGSDNCSLQAAVMQWFLRYNGYHNCSPALISSRRHLIPWQLTASFAHEPQKPSLFLSTVHLPQRMPIPIVTLSYHLSHINNKEIDVSGYNSMFKLSFRHGLPLFLASNVSHGWCFAVSIIFTTSVKLGFALNCRTFQQSTSFVSGSAVLLFTSVTLIGLWKRFHWPDNKLELSLGYQPCERLEEA